MQVYTVKPGDTLNIIALNHGFRSWKELYLDPSNASFRTIRPNPKLIVPGDQINIPPISYRMAIIDGTGPSDNGEYNPAMQNSFCRQLATNLGANAKYIRGPGPAGIELRDEAIEAHKAAGRKKRTSEPTIVRKAIDTKASKCDQALLASAFVSIAFLTIVSMGAAREWFGFPDASEVLA